VHRALGSGTVLLVDDELLVRMVAFEVLEELGYEVIEAEDGHAALQVLEANANIDLLLTDVGLPNGMNGRQLAEAARNILPDLKVLFITGYAEYVLLNHGNLASGMQMMTKPFTGELLSQRVNEIIGDKTG
jgi:CheY-like chemotaxis protein